MLYGFGRTYIKIIGRLRYGLFNLQIRKKKKRYISIVGCGQFSFSTILFFLYKKLGNVFLGCYDINPKNADTLRKFHGFKYSTKTFDELVDDNNLKVLYIASNHYTHAEYAIKALQKNKTVYIEKPISVNYHQFIELLKAMKRYKGNIYAGYNRPFAKAIKILNKYLSGDNSPFTLTCHINGHFIPDNHWYRNKQEGTRICGNVGHWLDLSFHLFNIRGKLPDKLKIQINYSNELIPDDNINISYTTDIGDLVSIVITSRNEPFEGISEIINFQNSTIIAKIDDFKKITIWKSHKRLIKKFWPKDVGHKHAILQPFSGITRDWKEVELSTLLMLHITDMVRNKQGLSDFDISEAYKNLKENLYETNNSRP
ncbi:MAG: Gfo/Idh/MocA family oxidoreductase [Clostridiaceae bacterium]|nr:Gfo/Idh/MocA family oxidoreductase [Clostridiaceae bacterium]